MTALEPGFQFQLEGGGEGAVVRYSSLHTAVESSRPYPPGATLRASIPGIACPLEVKVKSCKRITSDPVLFAIEGRLQNGTREMLAHLAKLPPP